MQNGLIFSMLWQDKQPLPSRIPLYLKVYSNPIQNSLWHMMRPLSWSRALDMRDNETVWHTSGTKIAVNLARAYGLSEEELVQVRWGALLHDIGKMGIPDNILHKPGPLTDEEWIVMKKHPVFAYKMLSPIAYLREALDIPYCHHEKWDGTGYPQGLRDTNIPLVARIFSIVDVWMP